MDRPRCRHKGCLGHGLWYARADGRAHGESDHRSTAHHLTVRPAAAVRGASASGATHLHLLGTFSLTDDAGQIVQLASSRARSLLAYLALHREVPQPRRDISFLLWPDSSEAQARNSLRQLVHQLRHAWPDSDRFLVTDPNTLGLRPGTGLTVDVDEYRDALAAAAAADQRPDHLDTRLSFERAADLYRGDLLPGSYEEWVVPTRERLVADHGRLLDRLVGLLEQHGDYRAAIEYGQQRSRLDPLDERIYRWLMRLHALDQDRAGALRVYQTCGLVLERELGVEPEPVTRQLYEQIARLEPGSAVTEATFALSRPVSSGTGGRLSPDHLPLTGRAHAWDVAMTAWGRMVEGEAHLLVISGEAGIGKTRLAEELCDWVGRQGFRSARTRAYEAEGRLPFAPVTDWLRSPALAGALHRLDVGLLSEISRLLPELLSQRPDLPRPSARIEDWQRQAFFHALASAFRVVEGPILLVLDDLQWCDRDTLEWLHFLLRSEPSARVFVTGTVRPDEVDRGHPMGGLSAGLADSGQLTTITLGPLEPAATSSLAALVAGRHLTPEQVQEVHRESEGNPLFVVEMVRAGLPARPTPGSPAAPPDPVTWAPAPRHLPPRMQAVIAGRLVRLSEAARDLASLAAVIGRAFTFDVVRAGSGLEDDGLVAALDELMRRQLVREMGNSAYDFSHDKIREVAYAEMTEARRQMLHRRVGEALERVHATTLDVVAAQVAAHFASADAPDRAAAHFRRAAEVAQRVGANQEAIRLLQRGLALLGSLPPSLDRDARELGLQTALGVSLVATDGYGAPSTAAVYARCRNLCQVLGQTPSPPTLRALALIALAQARVDEAHAIGEHLLSLAQRDHDPVLQVEAHFVLAVTLQMRGAHVAARASFEASLADYDRARSADHIGLYSQDPGVVCLIRLSLGLWLQGDPDGSARRRASSLELADLVGHPFTRAYALTWDAVLESHRGNAVLAQTKAEAAMELAREHRLPFWLSISTVVHGWATAEQGAHQAGIDEIREGMAAFKAAGSLFMRPYQLGLLAEQHGRLGQVERGLTLISEALAQVARTNERWGEPELLRRRGDLLAMVASIPEADAAYRQAMDLARYQGARSLELRSAVRLADSWHRQGRVSEATRLLEPIVQDLRAVVDLPDLDRARALLGVPGSDGYPRMD
jgi:DNA-binding SARP family transcriptional activator/predicted ATPase